MHTRSSYCSAYASPGSLWLRLGFEAASSGEQGALHEITCGASGTLHTMPIAVH